MWCGVIICFLLGPFIIKFGHGLPQRPDCHSSNSSNKKCKGSNDFSSFNRPCTSYFDCKFQPEGCESSAYFECDGTRCICELFGFTRDEFGALSVTWDKEKKGGMCSVRVGGPCGRDDGLEVKCETGYQCIDSQCRKMPKKQSTKGGCGQEQGCEFGSITPPCHDPRGCEFGRVPFGVSSEFEGERGGGGGRNLKTTKVPNPTTKNSRGCDERLGSCESRVVKSRHHDDEPSERPSKWKRERQQQQQRQRRPKPKRMEMDSDETESMDRGSGGNGGGGRGGSVFPPSSFRARASCGGGKRDTEGCSGDDEESASPQGCGGGGKGSDKAGGCSGGGNKAKPMGPRPNAPKPCREGNCGSRRKTTTTPPPTTRKPSCGGGGKGGCRPKSTTAKPKGCGRESGGCGGRRTTERSDRPPCGGNGNSGCGGGGGGGGRRPPKRRPEGGGGGGRGCRSEGGCDGQGGGGRGSRGCRSEDGCDGEGSGGGGSRRPKGPRPGPSPCKGCEAEVPKSKPSCGKGKSCGGSMTTTTTPKPTSCKEDKSKSCEDEDDDDGTRSEENRCDKFFPKLFTMQCQEKK